MKQTLVRYKTKAERADENELPIKEVFRELARKSPEDFRYMALRLGAGSFVQVVEGKESGNVLPDLEAFQSFQADLRDRCVEPPHRSEATIVGNYKMFGD